MRIHLVDPAGNPVDAPFSANSNCASVARCFDHEVGVGNAHRASAFRTDPFHTESNRASYPAYRTAMQSIGWEPFTSFGMLLEEDYDLTLTVVP